MNYEFFFLLLDSSAFMSKCQVPWVIFFTLHTECTDFLCWFGWAVPWHRRLQNLELSWVLWGHSKNGEYVSLVFPAEMCDKYQFLQCLQTFVFLETLLNRISGHGFTSQNQTSRPSHWTASYAMKMESWEQVSLRLFFGTCLNSILSARFWTIHKQS